MRPASLKEIYLSLLLAFLCYLLPWSGIGLMLRPDFVLVVLIYWMLRAPHLCNVGTAWTLGLLTDLASGGLLGQNALTYILPAFFAIHYQRRLVLFNELQQAGYALLLLLLSQVTLVVLKLFAGNDFPGWTLFLSSLSGLILWQLLTMSRMFGLENRNAV